MTYKEQQLYRAKFRHEYRVDIDIAQELKRHLTAEYAAWDRTSQTVFYTDTAPDEFSALEQQARAVLDERRVGRAAALEAEVRTGMAELWRDIKMPPVYPEKEIEYLTQHTDRSREDIAAFVWAEIGYVNSCLHTVPAAPASEIPDPDTMKDTGLNLIWYVSYYLLGEDDQDTLLCDAQNRAVLSPGCLMAKVKKASGVYVDVMADLIAAQQEILYRDYPEFWTE